MYEKHTFTLSLSLCLFFFLYFHFSWHPNLLTFLQTFTHVFYIFHLFFFFLRATLFFFFFNFTRRMDIYNIRLVNYTQWTLRVLITPQRAKVYKRECEFICNIMKCLFSLSCFLVDFVLIFFFFFRFFFFFLIFFIRFYIFQFFSQLLCHFISGFMRLMSSFRDWISIPWGKETSVFGAAGNAILILPLRINPV